MSNTVFVVKNQQDLYLSKQQEWVEGTDSQGLYRTRHRDEAINTVFEVSSRDIYLRAEAVACELDAKGNPALATVQALGSAKLQAADDLEMDEESVADPEESTPGAIDAEAASPSDSEISSPESIET